MKPTFKILIAIGALICLSAMLTAGYYLSGMILLVLMHQNPMFADWNTLIDAISIIEKGSREMKLLKVSVIAGFLISFCAPFLLIAILRGKSKNINVHGKSRFANLKEIEHQGLLSKKGILIGKVGKDYLRLDGYEFCLLAAPTRTGKGVSFCIPNLITFPDSAVVLDIKSENYNLTSEFRKNNLGQKIFYFNPFSENSHRWNPLSYISTDINFRVNDISALGNIIYKSDPKNPFWSDSARNLFLGLTLLVLETPALPSTIGEVLRQSSGKGKSLKEYLADVMEVRANSDKPLSAACIGCLNGFTNNSDDTLLNILASFRAPLALWQNPVIDKATCLDDFDLRDVRRQKMTIYICITPDNMLSAGFILNMFFSQLVNENVRELPEQNPALKYQCLMLLDEFTAMGKVEIIAKGVGFMAGYNMRLLIIIQDKSQLVSTYGKEDAQNISANMGVSIFFTPNDIDEAKKYSEMIGYDTIITRNAQHSNIGVFNSGRYALNEAEQQNKMAVMSPTDLLKMPQTKSLISRPGLHIIQSQKIKYYEDEILKKLFYSGKNKKVVVNGEERTIPIATPLPDKKWRYFYSSTFRSDYYIDGDFEDLTNDPESSLDVVEKKIVEIAENTKLSETEIENELKKSSIEWFLAASGNLNKMTFN